MLDRLLEGGEGAVPELLEVGPDGGEAFGVELVQPAGAVLAVDQETGLLQNLEVLGYGRPGHGQMRAAVASPDGWGLGLSRFAARMTG